MTASRFQEMEAAEVERSLAVKDKLLAEANGKVRSLQTRLDDLELEQGEARRTIEAYGAALKAIRSVLAMAGLGLLDRLDQIDTIVEDVYED